MLYVWNVLKLMGPKVKLPILLEMYNKVQLILHEIDPGFRKQCRCVFKES